MRGKRHNKTLPALVGIGIDLLSLKRARDLLKRHGRSFLDRILASCEKSKKIPVSSIQLARYFTAKEAFFKASGLEWTDLAGFSGMWIEKINGMNFEMNSEVGVRGAGKFFKMRGMWGAKVTAWKS